MNIYLRKISNKQNPHTEALKLLSEVYNKPYTLSYGEKSKPYIKNDNSFYFNISHSGEYVCLGVSDTEIGVDIEKHNKARTRLAKRFFSKREQSYCEDNTSRFFDIWTQKEAFIKAVGIGLSYGLNTFCIFDVQKGYEIRNIAAPEGYSLSVCKAGKINDITTIYC